MKILLRRAVLIAVSITASFCGQAWAAQAPFTVTITTDRPAVKTGSQVIINVRLTNTSKRDIACDAAYNDMLGMDMYDKYDIRDGGANVIEKNAIAHRELGGRSIRPACTLKPGESKVIGSDVISIAHNLRRPGEYTIQMSRAVSDNPRDGVVKSNKITVTVTE
jgi:hypothetical protein